jgi:hypothetical protein
MLDAKRIYSKFWWLYILVIFACWIAEFIILWMLDVYAEFSLFFVLSLLIGFIAALIIIERKGPGIGRWKLMTEEELEMRKKNTKRTLVRLAGSILALVIIILIALFYESIRKLLGL